jgi:DDE superfamily endonuclease
LQRHFKGQIIEPGRQCLGRFRVSLTASYEKELVTHALDLQRRFFGLTPLDMRRLAFQLAETRKLEHQFNRSKQMAGRKWLRNFMSRHNELALREPEATSFSRAVAFNKPQVKRFFDLLQTEYGKSRGIMADQVYNMDESGITAVHKPHRILARKGQKQIGKITSGERGKTVTVICAVNALGTYIPPLMIFPRRNMSQLLIKDGPPGTIGVATVSGWINSDVFIKWLNHFVAHAKPTPEKPVILLLDGHASHKTLAAVEFCRAKHITLLSFPPHTTHKLQPLNLCFFGPLKTFYNSACDNWMSMNA